MQQIRFSKTIPEYEDAMQRSGHHRGLNYTSTQNHKRRKGRQRMRSGSALLIVRMSTPTSKGLSCIHQTFSSLPSSSWDHQQKLRQDELQLYAQHGSRYIKAQQCLLVECHKAPHYFAMQLHGLIQLLIKKWSPWKLLKPNFRLRTLTRIVVVARRSLKPLLQP